VRVLILEDDPFIGLDLMTIVEGEGHQVVRLCDSVAEARGALAAGPDFALLDVEVADGTSYELATLLAARRIPFAFVSGSKRNDLPAHLRAVPFIAKPFLEATIRAALRTEAPARSGMAALCALFGDESVSLA
jgi:CheY-like chemotaxis protein